MKNKKMIDAQTTSKAAQAMANAPIEQTEDSRDSNVIRETNFGSVRKGTFGIKVKDADTDKVLYENKEEEYEYDVVDSLANVLVHAGAKFSDDQIGFLGDALKSDDTEADKTIAEATQELVKIYNSKLKADAKSAAYQSLVNKHKPLEGEKKESAQARVVANFIKLASVSKEVAIEKLKSIGAIPEDYTVANFDTTPLRRTKGDSEDE